MTYIGPYTPQTQSDGWYLNGAVYVDEVSDFILRDCAHSTNPMLGNATLYRNVDARLYAMELGAVRLGGGLAELRDLGLCVRRKPQR